MAAIEGKKKLLLRLLLTKKRIFSCCYSKYIKSSV